MGELGGAVYWPHDITCEQPFNVSIVHVHLLYHFFQLIGTTFKHYRREGYGAVIIQEAKAIFIQSCQFETNIIPLAIIILPPVKSDVRIANSKFWLALQPHTRQFLRIHTTALRASLRFWNTTFITKGVATLSIDINFPQYKDNVLLIEEGNIMNIDLMESYYASGKPSLIKQDKN